MKKKKIKREPTYYPTTMLYKHPGPHKLHGRMYDYIVVREEDVDKHLKEGWCKTTQEAYDNSRSSKASAIDNVSDSDSVSDPVDIPDRKELEKLADELGIDYTRNTTDMRLAEKIAAKSGD